MSQRLIDRTAPGRPDTRGSGVRRRRTATLAAAVLLGGALAAPSAGLAVANVPPIAAVDTFTGDEDTSLTGNVLANDSDGDGGTLSVLGYNPVTYGTLNVTAAGEVTFSPPPNYSGKQATSYWLADGQGGVVMGYLVLDLLPVNDAPVAGDDEAATDEDLAVAIAADTLLADDSDVDGDVLAVAGISRASHGTVVLAAGTATFTPDADWCGAADFDYLLDDGNGGTATGAVAVQVACVNDPPVAVDDTATMDQTDPALTVNVLENDSDPDGDPLAVTGATVAPAAGTVSLASDGHVIHAASVAPASSVVFAPADLFEGDAVVTYTISDGHGGTATGTLTVAVVKDEVAPVPVAPIVHFGTGRVNESVPVGVAWSATDAGVGVASYDVQVSVAGRPWTSLASGTVMSASGSFPFRSSLAFRVRATDRVGNTSDWVTTTHMAVDYQAPGNGAITYAGTWTSAWTTSASGVGYRRATTRGASATFQFTAREVIYVAPRNSLSGYVKVYVDGTYAGRYSLRATTAQVGQIIFRKAWSSSGRHTIKVVNDRAGARTNLDAFVVLR